MSDTEFTILDGSSEVQVPASLASGSVRVSGDSIAEALGWTLKAEGLCKGGACIPVRGDAGLVHDDGIDLAALAGVLGRPIAIDIEARTAALGRSAEESAATIQAKIAPDFTLPDLDGKMHSLSDFRGKKVLLVAYASW